MYCGRQEHVALSSEQKMEMESSTKMFITIYKITWCHIVNSNETHTQRVLPSPKIAPDNNPNPPPPPPPPPPTPTPTPPHTPPKQPHTPTPQTKFHTPKTPPNKHPTPPPPPLPHIERVLLSPKVAPENILPLHPKREKTKFTKFCA